jgi:hypothetical protein
MLALVAVVTTTSVFCQSAQSRPSGISDTLGQKVSELIKQHGLEALVSGLVFTPLQSVWKRFGRYVSRRVKEKNTRYKKQELRAKITQLQQFIGVAKGSAEWAQTAKEAELELSAAFTDLIRLDEHPIHPNDEHPIHRNNDARAWSAVRHLKHALYLYTPPRPAGWFFRAIFFVLLALTILATIGV